MKVTTVGTNQLCPTRGTVEGLVQPSSGFRCSKVFYILTTCPYFDNLEFDSFVAGGPQCHIITSVTMQLGFERFQDISFSYI